MEEQIISGKLNPHVDPVLDVWQWQVPVYLFLGGLAAGLLVLGALDVLRRSGRGATSQRLLATVPLILGLGMLALFLDLEHPLYVWRFYTAFRPSAPMSWGAWILVLVVPVNLLLVAATLRAAWPAAAAWLDARAPRLRPVVAFAEQRRDGLARLTVGAGVALGIYTGILLSAYAARPFWNTSILGLLFLVSGASSAAALVQMTGREHAETAWYARLDLGLIAAELALLALMIVGLVSGGAPQRQAADLVLGGPLSVYFWVFVVGLGLLLPAVLEAAHLRGRPIPRLLAPVFILAGGLVFRFFMVEAGQMSTWIPY